MGDILINNNKIPCKCKVLEELFTIVEIDYQHNYENNFVQFVLLNEFYSSSLCDSSTDISTVQSFCHENLSLDEDSRRIICSRQPTETKTEVPVKDESTNVPADDSNDCARLHVNILSLGFIFLIFIFNKMFWKVQKIKSFAVTYLKLLARYSWPKECNSSHLIWSVNNIPC